MPKIENWTTVFDRAQDDDAVQERVDKYGHGVIAKMRHDPTGCEVNYIMRL